LPRSSQAVQAVAARAGQRHRLAWALQDQPGLLTGAGARAPVPSVLRLIGEFRDAGATGIDRPTCPRCGRVIFSIGLSIGLPWGDGCAVVTWMFIPNGLRFEVRPKRAT
jgi:hypothetical protein